MTHKEINIVVAEPAQIVYEGLYNILTRIGGYFNIHKSDNLHHILRMNKCMFIDAVIMNPVLLQNQIDVFNNIKKEAPHIKWLALVYSFFDKNLLDMFDDIININDMPENITANIIKLIKTKHQQQREESMNLSNREVEVLRLLVTGHSNKEIADKLSLSTYTVMTHRKNISKKTSIKSISGLTIYAVAKRIIDVSDF